MLLLLFRVVSIAAPAVSDGYSYPQPPPLFDEPTSPPPIYLPPPLPPLNDDILQVVPTYLPPNVYPPIGSTPGQEILPPLDDSIVVSAPQNPFSGPSRHNPVQVLNMSCLDPKDGGGYFRTLLRSTSSSRVFPVIETSSLDCLVAPQGGDLFRIDLEGPRMVDCGIRSCGSRMCLIVRMATVPGLKLFDDPLITLQCIPQEPVVSHTKHLRLNAQSSEQGRSSARSVAVASGGNQRRFETQLTLLRKSGTAFDQPVLQGSSVRLGDELLLRCSVRDGDGWRYSRMGAVIVRSASSQRSIFLEDENRCRSPSVRSICPQQPQQVGPLSVQLPFRAFLFQGAAPADDLLLSVRMSGCLRPRDCHQRVCDEANRTRAARAAENHPGEEADVVAEFQFRVLPPSLKNLESRTSWPVIGVVVLGAAILVAAVVAATRQLYAVPTPLV